MARRGGADADDGGATATRIGPEIRGTVSADDEAAVEACHRAYFEALFDLFERHKERAGYGDHELVFFDSALDAVKKKSV